MTSPSASSATAARISAFQDRLLNSYSSDSTIGKAHARKQRLLGDAASQLDGSNELQEARARLRRTGEVKTRPDLADKHKLEKTDSVPPVAPEPDKPSPSVLEELDGLLDTAIKDHTIHSTANDSRGTTDDTTSRWPLPHRKSFTSKSPPKYASHRSSIAVKQRQPRQRQVQEDSFDSIHYNNPNEAYDPSIDSNKPRCSTDTDAGQYHCLASDAEHEVAKDNVLKQAQYSKSPVKQRAALFEKLSKHEAALVHELPDSRDAWRPTKITSIWPPNQNSIREDKAHSGFIPSYEKHHLKFHHGRDESPAREIPDPLPRPPSPQKAKLLHVPPIRLALPQLVSPRRRSRPDITSPYNARVVARAEPDHHRSAKKSHENQHRIHDLLVASQEAVKESVPEPADDQHGGGESTPPHLRMPGVWADSPRASCVTGKEIASPSEASPAGTITPSTPRGRLHHNPGAIKHSPSEEQDGTFKAEHKFALSRSRSRGGAVRVQVEIRSAEPSPERGREHTVIVTANVEPTDEDGPGSEMES